MNTVKKPQAVFYLSTGRAGSGTFAHLFQHSSLTKAFHVPTPEMIKESFLVQQCTGVAADLVVPKIEAISRIIDDSNLIYVETNPRLVFFIDQLNQHFDAKFIWVIRDPFEYVNSGLNRKWYTGVGGIWDNYRESPIDGWPKFWSVSEKIAWQWCFINSYIENKVARMENVRIAHFSDIIKNPDKISEILNWAGAVDISIPDIKSVLGLNINVGRYSAPRDNNTGDHIFGEKNIKITDKQKFNKNKVVNIILNYWNSSQSTRYLVRDTTSIVKTSKRDPSSYHEWFSTLKDQAVSCYGYSELLRPSDGLRAFLRHDLDLFDEKLMNDCRRLEDAFGVKSTWFFLPPKDKRYSNVSEKSLRSYIRSLKEDGHEIGYHVNAWETVGTFDLCDAPLKRIDEDIDWFCDAIGEPLRVAVAHGIPHHKAVVSNFSMFDALCARNVLMLDQFVIRDGGVGRKIPHFDARVRNPLFPTNLRFSYASDSGGPIRKDWADFSDIFEPPNNIIVNTHCANYPINRNFQYIDASIYNSRFLDKSKMNDAIIKPIFNRLKKFFAGI